MFISLTARSGRVRLDTGSLRYINYDGTYWPVTARPDVSDAYVLGFGGATFPSAYEARSHGMILRCLTR